MAFRLVAYGRFGCKPVSVVILVFLKFLASWGPFLESLGNFLGPKSNIYLKNKRIKSRVLADKPVYFVLFTGQ